jgi:hypothetical protein
MVDSFVEQLPVARRLEDRWSRRYGRRRDDRGTDGNIERSFFMDRLEKDVLITR